MSTDPSAAYRLAADIIRTNGHYKGAFFGLTEGCVGIELAAAERPVCIAGALSIAVDGQPCPYSDEYDAIAKRLADVMGLEPNPLLEPVGLLACWNDADERTPDDVIAALENAAKAAA